MQPARVRHVHRRRCAQQRRDGQRRIRGAARENLRPCLAAAAAAAVAGAID